MMRATAAAATVFAIALVALPARVQAAELRLSAGEIENLGIRFVQPAPASDAGSIEATARVVLPAAGEAVVSAPQAGLLTRLSANAGDEVVAGQVLAELSSPAFISLQREFLDALNAQRLAHSEYERDAQLHAEGIISARRLQDTTTRKAIADAALGEHRQLLALAGMRAEDLRALAGEQRLQPSLALRAPFGGVVTARLATAGERLDPMTPVYRLADLSELWLDISVPQEWLAAVRPGAEVRSSGDAGAWRGEVTAIGRAIDPATQTAAVRARLAPGGADLMPGQFLAVRVLTGGDAGATAQTFEIPAAAVVRSGGDSFVFVRTAGGVAPTSVDVVSVSGGSAVVRGALDGADTIAASGLAALKSMWAASAEQES